jgi:hypothetical protein
MVETCPKKSFLPLGPQNREICGKSLSDSMLQNLKGIYNGSRADKKKPPLSEAASEALTDGLLQVGQQVFYVFYAHTQAYERIF